MENQATALVLFRTKNDVCTQKIEFEVGQDDQIQLTRTNCIELEKRVKVEIEAINTNAILLKVATGTYFLFNGNENKEITLGEFGQGVKYVLAGTAFGWVDRSTSNQLQVLQVTDLTSEPKTHNLDNHCRLLRAPQFANENFLAVGCHGYKGDVWTQRKDGSLKVDLYFYDKYARTELVTFDLRKLGQIRYLETIFVDFDETSGQTYTLSAAVSDDANLRLFDRNGIQTKIVESGLTGVKNILALSYSNKQQLQDQDVVGYFAIRNVPIQGLIKRLLIDLRMAREFIFGLLETAKGLKDLNIPTIRDRLLNPGNVVDPHYLDQYGLRKRVVIESTSNVIYSLNTENYKMDWIHYVVPGSKLLRVIPGKEPGTLEYHYQQRQEDGQVRTLVQVISESEGKAMSEPVPAYFEGESKVFSIQGDENERIDLDFEKEKLYTNSKKKSFIFKVTDDGVFGYNTHNFKFNEIWNIKFQKDENLIDYSYHLKGTQKYFSQVKSGFYVQIPEDNTLLYKIVDSDNIAVITKIPGDKRSSDKLNVYIINGRLGKIIAKYQNNDADFNKEINLVYDDNGIFISYFNKKTFNTEIWVIEVLKNEIESDFLEM